MRPMDEPPEPAPDAHLLRFVAGRDVPCPACGYNLRDLQTARCPECGDELELVIRLAEPRQGALIGGLIGLASGFGLGGLLLVYLVIIVFMRGIRTSLMGEFAVVNALGCAAHGVALWLWIRNWHRIRRSPPAMRRRLVALCWAMPLAFIVIFAMTIR